MLDRLIDFASQTLTTFGRQLLFGLGPLILLGALLFFIQRAAQQMWVRAVGWKGVVYGTGWLGTPVHELSHWLVAKLFLIEVVELKLFEPDPQSGVLGYVRYKVPELSVANLPRVFGTFLMGIAPLFGGSIVIVGLWLLLVSPEGNGVYYQELSEFTRLVASGHWSDLPRAFWELSSSLYHEVFSDVGDPKAWVFLYLALGIGTHLAPSKADLEGGAMGFVAICVTALVANGVAILAGVDPAPVTEALSRGTAPLTCMLVFALVLTTGNLAVAGAVAGVAKLFRAREA